LPANLQIRAKPRGEFLDSTLETADDYQDLAAAANGDVLAFERLYRRYAPRVYGLCLRLSGQAATAEDCVQETFVSAWRSLPTFENRSRLTTWLHRIAVNAVLARRRGLAARAESAVDDPTILEALAGGVDGTPALDVERAILALPPGARDALVLVALYGYSHEEAATQLGIAVGTCKAQLYRARQLLAVRLGTGESKP
jgi:RNA polymerase sigma-70 factor (ECF subfamily)